MGVQVSIVMISHNKYPQNLYSLYALEKQTFNPKRMEVILVDDASTDKTLGCKAIVLPINSDIFAANRMSEDRGRKISALKRRPAKF